MYLVSSKERQMECQKLLSKNLWLLGISALSVLILALPLWTGSKYESLLDGQIKISMNSHVVHISSVSFFVAAVPVLVDVILDIISIYRNFHMNPSIIMRLVIGITFFLTSLQLTVMQKYPSIFGLTRIPEYSFLLALYSLRIVVISAALYNLTVLNPTLFKFEWSLFLTIMTCAFTVMQCYSFDNPYILKVSGIITLSMLILHALAIIYWSRLLIIKCQQSFTLDNYTSLLYVVMYSIVLIASLGLEIHNDMERDTSPFKGIPFCHSDALGFFIYTHTFLALFMMIAPGRLARYEAYLNMANIVRTKTEYVRYISHEMRTPMNTVYLGLNLALNQLPEHSERQEDNERKETLQEISSACKAALDILNELLLYDKLESGMLVLNKTDVKVPSLIYDAVSMFGVQLREKQLDLMITNSNEMNTTTMSTTLTVHELAAESAESNDPMMGVSDDAILSSSSTYYISDPNVYHNSAIVYDDMIHIDQYKIIQVIRNIISNAIKFTPMNGKIHVNMKFEPMEVHGVTSISNSSSSKKASLPRKAAIIVIRCIQHIWICLVTYWISIWKKRQIESVTHVPDIEQQVVETATIRSLQKNLSGFSTVNTTNNTKAIHGYLVIEITDTGAGINAENQKKLFHEIIQFQPEVLQHGGGSGLGMWISKSIMDLHQGQITVYSQGAGFGSTFTLKIPMTRTIRKSRTFNMKKIPSPLIMRNAVDDKDEDNKFREVEIEVEDDDGGEIRHSYSSSIYGPHSLDEYREETMSRISTTHTHIPLITSSTISDLDIFSPKGLKMESHSSSSETYRPDTPTSFFLNSHSALLTERSFYNSPQASGRDHTLRFLVVDDSSMNRKMLCRLLKSLGHTCDEANDGVEAVRLIKSTMMTIRKSSPINRHNMSSNKSLKGDGSIATTTFESTGNLSLRTTTTSTPRSASITTLDSIHLIHRKSRKSLFHISNVSSNTINSNMMRLSQEDIKVNDSDDEHEETHEVNEIQNEVALDSSSSHSIMDVYPTYMTDLNDSPTMTVASTPTFYYDAITMDFMMPHMDGPTATAEIRKLGYTGPIIGVTGNALPSDIDYFKEKGATSVLIKPIEIDALQAVLTKYSVSGNLTSRHSYTDLNHAQGHAHPPLPHPALPPSQLPPLYPPQSMK